MDLSHEDVQSILQAIGNGSVEEFHLETRDLMLVIKKKNARSHGTLRVHDDPAAPAPLPEAANTASRPTAGVAQYARLESPDGGIEIKAPMLGTFYRSPSPGAPPFIELGTIVSEGDIVCIIEVMKLMNSITSGCRGRVAAILVDDATIVEYDQTLLVIEPLP